MILKNIFTIGCLLSAIMFASCNNEQKQNETKTQDTTSVKTPAQLSELNTQLLANPNSGTLLNKRANYYLNKNNFNEAMQDITKAISIDSSQSDYFLTLSNVYFMTNQTGNSKSALEKSIKLDDKNVEAILKLAELYLYVKKNDKSIDYINMALKIDKYNAKAYFMKGMNFKEKHDTARAISSMQTAVEQDQTYYNAYIQLGLLCAAQHNPLASQYYKNAIKINPKSTEAWYDLGKYEQDEGYWNKALEAYNELLKVDGRYKYAHYNMGVIYFMGLKKNEEAIGQFTEAITIEPKYVEAYYARGVVYKEMKNRKKAVEDFNACMAITPEYEPAVVALREMK